jgi:hypothetical protein
MYEDLKTHLEGQVAYHRANVRVYMKNSAGIGEHNDIVASIKEELSKLAEAEDMLNALQKHCK